MNAGAHICKGPVDFVEFAFLPDGEGFYCKCSADGMLTPDIELGQLKCKLKVGNAANAALGDGNLTSLYF